MRMRTLIATTLVAQILAWSAAATALAANPAANPGAGTTAKVVMHAPLRVLDPVLTNAYITRNHGYLIYDTLFALDAQARPQPQMVDSWTVSDDKLTWTFKLRTGLKFHDGAPVTGADVVASLKRWATRDAMGTRLMAATQTLDSPAADTFRFVLKQPYGLVLETLGKPGVPVPFIMPARIAATPATTAITEYVGSGPYRFDAAAFQPGVKAVYLKNTDYVPRAEPPNNFSGGKVAMFDRLEVVNMTDAQTAVNALRQGEIDFIENVAPDLMPQLDGAKGVTVQGYGDNTNMYMLRMNWKQPPFDNVKIRRAVLAALYQVDYLEASLGDPRFYQLCGAMLSCISAYRTEVGATQTRPADVAHARALLKEAGYKGEKVVVLHPTDVRSLVNLAPVTAQALRDIGMNVEVQNLDWATLLARRSKDAPLDQGGWSIFHSSLAAMDLINPIVNPILDDAYPGWAKDDQMNKLRDEFALASGLDEQKRVAEALQKRGYDQVTFVPLGGYSEFKAYDAKFTGMVKAPVVLFWKGQ
ncbi:MULTISPECIES: ABC transporter substrate-binding protein [unclassified Achromobacter]|uniref:ABC transporter substrate-binding protein n=1 Tax=unclassified Achromobacter TaxID=2626865 RepID=UPI000B514EAC|nr:MULTISPECIES: ABC transporter substrate-binding protein [unclassified Achromobacter]OWT68152.1 ABC transporter substrate-binding protein [Achromobacter sp. HZ34]OWT69989.1 ABC transporter substrate-binding protein [Achromobacter sp. HZ28]